MNIGIGSGDGNSIFEIAAKYEKMQLREMRKNIETIKQGLRSGTDTGSTKFLDDMEKLSGLVLQLKVKTGFIVSDDLEPLVNDEIEKAKIDLDYAGKITDDALTRITNKQATTPDARISDKQYDSWLNEIKTNISDNSAVYKLLTVMSLKNAFLVYFDPPGRMQKTEYAAYKSMDAEIDRLKTLMKSTLNTNKIMSTTAFEKLNTISDTIPNIINQILSLALGMSRIVVTKINEWSTEISNEDLSKVIDTSNELIEDVALINSKAGIQPYITIYKKLKKPIEDIYKSVNEMGKLAGVISYDENVKNQFKYTNTIGYTNRTGPRPLILGAAPNTQPAPAARPLAIIKKSIDEIGALFKAGNVTGFLNSFNGPFSDLTQTLITEGLLTDQLSDTDPLVVFIDELQESSMDYLNDPIGVAVSDDEKRAIDKELDLTYKFIESLFKKKSAAQPTGASGVGETKGAGKFMHSYHAKRFL
jgi:hypothetical protein